MQTRAVTGKAFLAGGNVASGQLLTFELENGVAFANEFVLPQTVQVSTNHLGEFSAVLWCSEEGEPDVLWKVTFPTGEIARFAVPIGTGSIPLLSLLPSPAPSLLQVDDDEWVRRKHAVVDYSLHRPLLELEAFVPVAGQKEQALPEGVFGIDYIVYGEEFTLSEVLLEAEGTAEQGWCLHNGKLYLTPAPTAGQTVNVIWRKLHPADEQTRSFPTIPEADLPIIQLLAAADQAEEEQAAVESGLTSYTIGGTTVKWGQQGGATVSGSSRALRLRERAMAMLRQPLGQWG